MNKIKLFQLRRLISKLLVTAVFWSVYPPTGMAQYSLKNIENNTTPTKKNEDIAGPVKGTLRDETIYISKLDSIHLGQEVDRENFIGYWMPFIGKKVTNQDIYDFKEWAWRQFRQARYFAYINTEAEKSGKNESLYIKTTIPTIQNITVDSSEVGIAEKYKDIIISSLGKQGGIGEVVDIIALEQKLDQISFSQPLSLTLNVRQAETDKIILGVDVSTKKVNQNNLISGAVQFNNYGLSQYGKSEFLGVFNFSGLTPDSLATLTAQGAEGLAYARVDYEAPNARLGGHFRLFGESVLSKDIISGVAATQGNTSNFGVGLTNIIGSERDLIFKSNVDIAHRETNSKQQSNGIEIKSLVDNQARLKFSADNNKFTSNDIEHYEASIVVGSDDSQGQYYFSTLGASLQNNISDNGLSVITNLRAQILPSRNLDAYNRFTLGGVNGVRAYTTLDGVGDAGVFSSIELVKRYSNTSTVGVFIDSGLINQNRNFVANQYNSVYSLQALGVSFTGLLWEGANYSASIAQAVGSYDAYDSGVLETAPHTWRVNFALSYNF